MTAKRTAKTNEHWCSDWKLACCDFDRRKGATASCHGLAIRPEETLVICEWRAAAPDTHRTLACLPVSLNCRQRAGISRTAVPSRFTRDKQQPALRHSQLPLPQLAPPSPGTAASRGGWGGETVPLHRSFCNFLCTTRMRYSNPPLREDAAYGKRLGRAWPIRPPRLIAALPVLPPENRLAGQTIDAKYVILAIHFLLRSLPLRSAPRSNVVIPERS